MKTNYHKNIYRAAHDFILSWSSVGRFLFSDTTYLGSNQHTAKKKMLYKKRCELIVTHKSPAMFLSPNNWRLKLERGKVCDSKTNTDSLVCYTDARIPSGGSSVQLAVE